MKHIWVNKPQIESTQSSTYKVFTHRQVVFSIARIEKECVVSSLEDHISTNKKSVFSNAVGWVYGVEQSYTWWPQFVNWPDCGSFWGGSTPQPFTETKTWHLSQSFEIRLRDESERSEQRRWGFATETASLRSGNCGYPEGPGASGVFAEWQVGDRLGPAVWERCWLENCCTTVFGTKIPEACCARWSSFASNWISSIFRTAWWKQHYCFCPAAKDSWNYVCFCLVVCWLW